jgi:hypothetical protein
MQEHDERADELEQEADRLGEKSDRVGGDIDDVRSDFESKLGDAQAPGLLDEEAATPGGTGVPEEDDEQDGEEQS